MPAHPWDVPCLALARAVVAGDSKGTQGVRGPSLCDAGSDPYLVLERIACLVVSVVLLSASRALVSSHRDSVK